MEEATNRSFWESKKSSKESDSSVVVVVLAVVKGLGVVVAKVRTVGMNCSVSASPGTLTVTSISSGISLNMAKLSGFLMILRPLRIFLLVPPLGPVDPGPCQKFLFLAFTLDFTLGLLPAAVVFGGQRNGLVQSSSGDTLFSRKFELLPAGVELGKWGLG